MAISILMAEDDEDDRLFFTEALREICDQTKLAIANDGNEFLQLLQKHRYNPIDLVILDINMPGVNGIECLESIRRDEELKDVPVIMMSTAGEQAIIDLAYRKGATRYFVKPDSMEGLKRAVKQILTTDWKSLPPKQELASFKLVY